MYVRLSLKDQSYPRPQGAFPWLRRHKTKRYFGRYSQEEPVPGEFRWWGAARREVREPEKIKVEDYEREGESPGGVLPYKSHVCMCRPKG